ncbi:DciA family protein [Parabacteroides sp. PF5-9]|uniref:DciA family protein n=1 Tax=Parabacteroides sp. PF5-9 TaxID=1742404 RepID=UPI002475D558|nr:DciA family protein [Parabacteroides sp. PF5-9]MDH6357564.1 putative nucleic acid-binding Zn ribbon protein [Parabacteroides sp. PF5-9]
MRRKNSQTIGEVLRDFFEQNTDLHQKILESRIERAWGEVLGPMVMQYTRNIYIKNGVMYVSLSSSVLRSELTLCRERLVKSLNEYAGGEVIRDLVIR